MDKILESNLESSLENNIESGLENNLESNLENNLESNFESNLQELGIVLSIEQKEQFANFYEMLIEYNKVMNLTSITERLEVYSKHFIDSLSLCRLVELGATKGPKRVIDIGTGAGFPGIPLKIAFPELEIVLLDSLNKRVKFLNAVIKKLKLQGIKAIHGRAEEMAKQKEYREAFDIGVSRAVSKLSVLSEYCIPYIRVGGIFISYKSGLIDEELKESKKAISILGGKIDAIDKFQLIGTDMGRSLVKIQKERSTPKKYPRKAGTPAKEPLR